MEFIVDNIGLINQIKTNVDRNIFLTPEFYSGVKLSAELDDLDLEIFGCWNGGCEDKFKSSNKGSIHQQFLVNLLNNYNENNNKQVNNKLRITLGDNIYFSKSIKEVVKKDKGLKKAINTAGILDSIPNIQIQEDGVTKDINMKDLSVQLIEKGFTCLTSKPTLMCLGNHDIEPLFTLHHQIKKAYDTIVINENKVRFTSNWILPSAFYAVEFTVNSTKLLFVFIDTNLLEHEYALEQAERYKQNMIEWLETILSSHPNHAKFVIGHCPIFYYAHKKDKESIGFTTRKVNTDKPSVGQNFFKLYEILIKNKVKSYMAADEHNLQYLVDQEHDIIHLSCGASPGGGGGDETDSFKIDQQELYFSSTQIEVPVEVKAKMVKRLILNSPSFMKLNLNPNMIQINLIGPSNLSHHSSIMCSTHPERCKNLNRERAIPEVYNIVTIPRFIDYVSVYDCDKFIIDNCK